MSKDHNSLIVGKVLLEFKKLDSTNEYAMNLVSQEHPEEGTVILTQNQVNGRGQMGTIWQSEADSNLTFSIILYPTFLRLNDQFYLNKAVAVAVATVLQEFFQDLVFVKWPNDIYIQSRKVGGILIQNIVQGISLKASVVGIGINVNQMTFPASLPNPTSMALEGHAVKNIQDLLNKVMLQIDLNYRNIRSNKQMYDHAYKHLLYRRQQQTDFYLSEGVNVRGYIQDVDAQGALEIMIDGQKRSFSLKEISYQ